MVIKVVDTTQSLIKQTYKITLNEQKDATSDDNDRVSKLGLLAALYKKECLTQEEFEQQKIS